MRTNVNFPGQERASAQYDLTTFNNLACVYQESAEKASMQTAEGKYLALCRLLWPKHSC